ncbi:hypothetical protein B0H10DRAFT_1977892 [Mycena sp. CBHHK59/15]|nr:hypothetical protein B0H10DRAFT_1977892 [Mycena sp. CBHHK59/15]
MVNADIPSARRRDQNKLKQRDDYLAGGRRRNLGGPVKCRVSVAYIRRCVCSNGPRYVP